MAHPATAIVTITIVASCCCRGPDPATIVTSTTIIATTIITTTIITTIITTTIITTTSITTIMSLPSEAPRDACQPDRPAVAAAVGGGQPPTLATGEPLV